MDIIEYQEAHEVWVMGIGGARFRNKELTPRQVREQEAYEAERVKPVRPHQTAADRRNFYRKQAGWPQLREPR